MPILDFKDDKKTHGKVLVALLRMGCLVEARDGSKLVVTLAQEEALINAGLIPPRADRKEPKSRGKKYKT